MLLCNRKWGSRRFVVIFKKKKTHQKKNHHPLGVLQTKKKTQQTTCLTLHLSTHIILIMCLPSKRLAHNSRDEIINATRTQCDKKRKIHMYYIKLRYTFVMYGVVFHSYCCCFLASWQFPPPHGGERFSWFDETRCGGTEEGVLHVLLRCSCVALAFSSFEETQFSSVSSMLCACVVCERMWSFCFVFFFLFFIIIISSSVVL